MVFSIFERPLPIHGFSFTNILEYIVKLNETHEGHGQSSALKESIAGSKLFQKNFIEEFRFTEPKEGFTMINCKVKAEQKSISYIICMTINTENEVLHASCECPGGAPTSCCKHTFAVLTFIQDYCAKELHSAQTEKLQEWHRPSKKKKKKFSPKKVEEVFKSKASSSKKDVKPVNFNALATLPPNAPIFSVIRQSDFDFSSHLIRCTMKLPITHVETFNYKVELKDIKLTLDQILFFKEKVSNAE